MGKVEGVNIVDLGTAALSGFDFLELASDDNLKRWLRQLAIVKYDYLQPFNTRSFWARAQMIPYLEQAWREIDGQPGVSGRLWQLSRVYDLAEQRCAQAGIGCPNGERIIDYPSFTFAYHAGELCPGGDF